jgi:hypothetical protein
MSDYSFFDDQFDDMISNQKSESGTFVGIPTTYLTTPGTYFFRIYPENYKGAPRLRRTIWSHKLVKQKIIALPKEDTRITELVNKLKEKGPKKGPKSAFTHALKFEGVFLGYIIKAPEGKYVAKANTVSALVMNGKQLDGFQSFIENFGEEGASLKQFLDPRLKAKAIKLVVTSKKGANGNNEYTHSFSKTDGEYDLPNLEDSLPEGVVYEGLDNLYVKTSQTLTDKLYSEFKNMVEANLREFEAYQTTKQNPDDEDSTPGYDVDGESNSKKTEEVVATKSVEAKKPAKIETQQATASNDDRCQLITAIANNEVSSADYPSVGFGIYPDDDNTYCMICPNQVDCMKLTKKSSVAA